ncbi:MAG: hypothetical protein ABR991_06355 [Terracidiphilus sp.]|jgi:hypothetical protein
MARKVWIALLGFGLLLFIVLDLLFALLIVTDLTKPSKWWFLLLWGCLMTWDIYRVLRKRIKSKPQQMQTENIPNSTENI